MKKNILIINTVFPPELGGTGIILKNIAKELIKNNINVIVLTGGKRTSVEFDGQIKVYKVPTKKELNPNLYENYFRKDLEDKFLNILKTENIDITYFNSTQGLGANLINLSLENKKITTLLTIHDFWWITPNLFLDKNLNHINNKNQVINSDFLIKRNKYLFSILNNPKLNVITVSKTMKTALSKFNIPRASNIKVIENGVSEIKTIKDVKRNKVIFGYFGGDNEEKGFFDIIKAIDLLNLSKNKYEIKCYGIHRPLIKKIKYFKLLYKHNISLHEPFDNKNVADIIGSIDCLLIPSNIFESFSLVAREALVSNKIILTSNIGALSEIKSKNHLTFSSLSDLSNKLKYVIDNIDKLRNINNSHKIDSLETQVKKLIEVFN